MTQLRSEEPYSAPEAVPVNWEPVEIPRACRGSLRFTEQRPRSTFAWYIVGHADELLTGNRDFARELRDSGRLEPVDAAPIAAAEAQEFFWVLQCMGYETAPSAAANCASTCA